MLLHANVFGRNLFFPAFVIFFALSAGTVKAQIQNKLSDLNYSVTGDYNNLKERINDYFTREQSVQKTGGKLKPLGKTPNWNNFRRWEYYWEQRIDLNTGEFPLTNAAEQYQNFRQKNTKASGFNEHWVNLGTNTSGGGYAGLGRINCIAFHPTDVNTFWAGSPSGGLWKTTNGGTSWTNLNDNLPVLGVSDIVLTNDFLTSNTMYIATGDRDGGSMWTLGGSQAADNASVGVLKSTDGGITWNSTGLTYAPSAKKLVYKLVIHPSNNQILLAATSDGIMKSTDGGSTWSVKNSNKFVDIEFKPGDPSVIYASTLYYSSAYVFRSTNTGDTWFTVATVANGRRSELAVTPADPAVVYQLITNSGGGVLAIYKSTNSGASFAQVNTNSATNPGMLGYYSDGSGSATGQGSYDLCIAASPTDANTVYIGGVTMWKSTDGGANWAVNNMWTSSTYYNFVNAPVVHADKHVLTFQNAATLFEGNDGGIYKSTNGGLNWTDLTNGMVISQIYRIGISKTDNNKILAGLQDNGTKKYNGAVNTWSDVYGGDGMECIIDNNNAVSYMYVTYVDGQIYRSSNGFSTSSTTKISDNIPGKPSGAWVTPYIMDPANSAIIYAGYDQVWKTSDRGNSWTSMSQQLSASDKLRSLAVAPSNSNILYTADMTKLWKTTDGGATNWTQLTVPFSGASITYIAVKADDPNTVWITYGGFSGGNKVFESTDGGATWANISSGLPNLPVMSITQYRRATDRNILFVGTDVGVYAKDGSADWAAMNSSLPNVVVTELEVFYSLSGDKLRAGTFGRGLWETPIAVPSSTPAIPVLVSPVNAAVQVSIEPVFKWNNVSGASGYYIQLAADSNFASILYEGSVADTFMLSRKTLNNNTVYYWRVKATGGDYSAFNSLTTCTAVVPSLNYPVNNAIVYTLAPVLHWSINQPIAGIEFDVLLSTDSLFDSGSTVISNAGSATQYALSGLLPTTRYYWKVRTKTTDGNVISYSVRQDFTTYGVLAVPTPSWPVGSATVYTLSPDLYWYMSTPQYSYTFEARYKQTSSGVWSSPVAAGSSLSLKLNGLLPGTSYDWQVRSNNGTSYSDWSATQTFITFSSSGSVPPRPIASYPTGGVTVYNNSPVLYWYINSSTAGINYSLQVSKAIDFTTLAADFSGIAMLYQQLSNLDPGCKYYWRVKSYNGATWSSWSAIDSFVTYNISGNLTPVLSYPVGGTTVYSTTPALYWYTLGGIAATQYEIQYAKDEPVFSTTLSSATTSCTLPALQYGGKYYWRVRGKQGSIVSSWSGIDSFEVTGKAGSLTPILTWPLGGALSSTSPTLYWYVNMAISGMTFYIEYADNESFSNSVTATSTAYSKELTGLTPGTTYYWRVKTYNGSQYSPYSTTATFITTSGSTPSRPQCGSPSGGVVIPNASPVLSWFLPAPGQSISYELQYANTPEFTNPVTVVNLSSSNYSTGTLTSSLPVYWRVRSKSSSGIYSQYSVPGYFVPVKPAAIESNGVNAESFVLLRNYPNPFNPSTTIEFNLPELSRVSINIYNQLGQKVTELLNTDMQPGRHTLNWEASNCASGIYYCEMKTGKIRMMTKLVLIR